MTTPSLSSDPRLPAILGKVRVMGACLARRCPKNVAAEDLIGAGYLGVATALSRHTEDSGELEAYALTHARGAMFDELRHRDPMTRGARRHARQALDTVRTLRAVLQREPDDAEIAAAMGLDEAKYHSVQLQMAFRSVSFDAPQGGERGETVEMIDREDSAEELFSQHEEARDMKAKLWDAVAKLPPRQAETINLLFRSDELQTTISKVLGVSEGRISQLRKAALASLRRAYGANDIGVGKIAA